jgi:hypothetical protein
MFLLETVETSRVSGQNMTSQFRNKLLNNRESIMSFPAFILQKILIIRIMKKLFLLSVVLVSQAAAAQELVWSNSFETADDLQGWTIHDLNNNGNAWSQGKNIYHNGTTMAYGTSGTIRHSINLVPSGTAANFASENDWIISPEIDLSSLQEPLL